MTEINAKEKEKELTESILEKFSLEREQREFFLKQRKLFLWEGVDDETAKSLVLQLLYLDSQSKEDIYLFINSPGGVISSGLAVYDAMQAIRSDVVTVVCGQAASMGAVLAAAGTAGKRYCWPNSRIMIHQPLINGQFYGPATDVQIQAEEMLKVRQKLNRILAKHTGRTEEQIEKETDRDNFMSAEEAKAYGLVDSVETLF